MPADGPAPPIRVARPGRQRPGALLPVTPVAALGRARLDERIDAASRHRLTVVSGGPGWGKSTATASWAAEARRAGRDAAWLTLEEEISTPASFWDAVLGAVKAHLKALYRKLGVGSRRDAVRRARELGLLP